MSRPEQPLLRAEKVCKYFPVEQGLVERLFGDDRYVKAVDGVNLSVQPRETVGVVGESGCGKTTLGRVLARLYKPTGGTVSFEGRDVASLSRTEQTELRQEVQYIFQDPLSSLNPRKTAGEIVRKPLEIHGVPDGGTPDERTHELFKEVGLSESHLDRYPHELSGGQRQRIGIARALSLDPQLIVADEPVSALDVSVQSQIINLMMRLQKDYDLSYVFIAHDLSVVKHISDRVIVMYLGQIMEEGTTDDIFENPQHPYTRALLSSVPRIDGHQRERRTYLEGNPPSPIDPPAGCPFSGRCPEYIGEQCDTENPALAPVDGSDASGGSNEATDRGEVASNEVGPATDVRTHRVACHWRERPQGERSTSAELTLEDEPEKGGERDG